MAALLASGYAHRKVPDSGITKPIQLLMLGSGARYRNVGSCARKRVPRKPTSQGLLPQMLVPDKLHLPTINAGHYTVISGKIGHISGVPTSGSRKPTRSGHNQLTQEAGKQSDLSVHNRKYRYNPDMMKCTTSNF